MADCFISIYDKLGAKVAEVKTDKDKYKVVAGKVPATDLYFEELADNWDGIHEAVKTASGIAGKSDIVKLMGSEGYFIPNVGKKGIAQVESMFKARGVTLPADVVEMLIDHYANVDGFLPIIITDSQIYDGANRLNGLTDGEAIIIDGTNHDSMVNTLRHELMHAHNDGLLEGVNWGEHDSDVDSIQPLRDAILADNNAPASLKKAAEQVPNEFFAQAFESLENVQYMLNNKAYEYAIETIKDSKNLYFPPIKRIQAEDSRQGSFNFDESNANIPDRKTKTGFMCHSGGAIGSDAAWGNIGAKYQVKTNHYQYTGKTPYGNTQITEDEYNEGMVHIAKANETLKRNISSVSDYVKGLFARNWIQVRNADAIYAIAESFKAVNGKMTVNGGTGYAVQMAIDIGKPVYVYDIGTKSWKTYNYSTGKFDTCDTPTLTQNFAGIGTRGQNGKLPDHVYAAIKSVFENTMNSVYQKEEDIKRKIQSNEDFSMSKDEGLKMIEDILSGRRSFRSSEEAVEYATGLITWINGQLGNVNGLPGIHIDIGSMTYAYKNKIMYNMVTGEIDLNVVKEFISDRLPYIQKLDANKLAHTKKEHNRRIADAEPFDFAELTNTSEADNSKLIDEIIASAKSPEERLNVVYSVIKGIQESGIDGINIVLDNAGDIYFNNGYTNKVVYRAAQNDAVLGSLLSSALEAYAKQDLKVDNSNYSGDLTTKDSVKYGVSINIPLLSVMFDASGVQPMGTGDVFAPSKLDSSEETIRFIYSVAKGLIDEGWSRYKPDEFGSISGVFDGITMKVNQEGVKKMLEINSKPVQRERLSKNAPSKSYDSREAISMVTTRLNGIYGSNMQIMTNQEFIDYGAQIGRNFSGVRAAVVDGDVVINTDKASTAEPLHELTHLILPGLRHTNALAYELILNKIQEHPNYQEIAKAYPELTGRDLDEEVFCTVFGEYFRNEMITADEDAWLDGNFEKLADSVPKVLQAALDIESVEATSTELMNMSIDQIMSGFGSNLIQGNYRKSYKLGRQIHNNPQMQYIYQSLMDSGDLILIC